MQQRTRVRNVIDRADLIPAIGNRPREEEEETIQTGASAGISGEIAFRNSQITSSLEDAMAEAEALDSQLMTVMSEMNHIRRVAVARAETMRDALKDSLAAYTG